MPRPLPSRGQILTIFSETTHPVHARVLAEKLGVNHSQFPRLLALLDQLCVEGAVQRKSGQRYAVKAREDHQQTITGILGVNPRGFGFVVSAGHPDVFVGAEGIGGALHGDTVVVSVISRSSRGPEGRVVSIQARRNPRVAGTLRKRRSGMWLEPDDARLRGPIVLLASTVEGKDGVAAVAEITQFPESAEENPEGILISVLGAPGDPNVEVAKILVREQIEELHPPAAIQEAEAQAARIQKLTLEGRRDLRGLPLPTIDPEEARDHDDALWVEKTESGYRAYIAIADVSEYVQPGSALDVEARARGCTLYLPDRAVPMLPGALAADLCSLLPDRDRLCLCVIADLDQKAQVQSFEVVEGVMRSAAMLTYNGVALALGFTSEGTRSIQAEAMKPGLRVLEDLARKLRKARIRRGALDLDLPEAHVILDEKTGAPLDVVRRAKDPGIKRAYQMVEELMLLANELVAQWLCGKGALGVFRVHAAPELEKLERLGAVADRIGLTVDLEQLRDPEGLSRWLARIAEHPRRTVLEMLALRSLKQAFYDIVNIGHFGLASDAYLHFTSPIRRYPDLVVHRIVKSILRGVKLDKSPSAVENLRTIATHSSVRERASMEVEREVVDLYRAVLMRDHLGEEFDGKVTGVIGTGVFVALDNPYVDVLVRYEGLGADRYELVEGDMMVVGQRSGDTITLGDPMRVRIDDVSILRRQVTASRVVAVEGRKRGRNRAGKSGGTRPEPNKKPSGGRSNTARPAKKSKRKSRR